MVHLNDKFVLLITSCAKFVLMLGCLALTIFRIWNIIIQILVISSYFDQLNFIIHLIDIQICTHLCYVSRAAK